MNFINVRKYITLKPLRNYDFKHHMKPILIFFGMSVATTIYTNLDTVMLKFMQGNEAAGYYTAAVKVKTVLVGVVTSIGTVLLPRVSYYIEQKRHDEFRKVTAKAMELVVMMHCHWWFILSSMQGKQFWCCPVRTIYRPLSRCSSSCRRYF